MELKKNKVQLYEELKSKIAGKPIAKQFPFCEKDYVALNYFSKSQIIELLNEYSEA